MERSLAGHSCLCTEPYLLSQKHNQQVSLSAFHTSYYFSLKDMLAFWVSAIYTIVLLQNLMLVQKLLSEYASM